MWFDQIAYTVTMTPWQISTMLVTVQQPTSKEAIPVCRIRFGTTEMSLNPQIASIIKRNPHLFRHVLDDEAGRHHAHHFGRMLFDCPDMCVKVMMQDKFRYIQAYFPAIKLLLDVHYFGIN